MARKAAKPAKRPGKAKPKPSKPKPRAAAPRPAPPKPSRLVLEEPAPAPPPPPPPEPPLAAIPPEELIAALPAPEPGRQAKRFIILDSNALMMQFQFSVDIENELRRLLDIDYEIIVPDIVVGELRHLAGSLQGKERGEAVMAIKLALTFRVVRTEGPADTGILRVAEKLNAVVVTNDKILRARLRAKNIANIHLRSKAFLTVEGHIGF